LGEPAVDTLSAVQLRGEASRANIGRWRAYAQRLRPLRDALGA
jgi:hypothetical protein